jgi:mycothiol S-conjugate amidase
MTTYDELGGYPHPDHVMTHTVSMAAFEAAGDPEAFPHAGPAWQPLKLYYNAGRSRARFELIHDAMVEAGHESPYAEWLDNWQERRPEGRITRVPAAEYFEVRDRALLAHATQVDPDGWFFKVPLEVQQRVWPTDDFEQAVSFVPVAEGEDDLFAGLGTPEQADALAVSRDLTPIYDDRRPQEGQN